MAARDLGDRVLRSVSLPCTPRGPLSLCLASAAAAMGVSMNLLQRLLAVPAALGLASPLAGNAADLNLRDARSYASEEQVTSIDQFSDVRPTDWAYQALSNLIERYGCVAGYPDGTYRGPRAMTRYEAAALLNACLDRISEVTDELKRLMKEFEKELAVLRGRVDGLEAKVGELEATQFSTTTTLRGRATWVIGATRASGDSVARGYNEGYGATTFSYDLRLELNTSFTGKDLLFTRVRAGNFDNAFIGRGLNMTRLNVASDSGGNVIVDRLNYRFPVGDQLEFVVGPLALNTEFLGARPGVYGRGNGDWILEFFTLWGTPGVYNKAKGAIGGVIWKPPASFAGGRFSLSANYLAPTANIGGVRTDDNDFACNPGEGGIGNGCSRASFLAQLGWTGRRWGLTAAYRHGQRGSNFRHGTEFVADNGWWLRNGTSNSVALNGYWQPRKSGWMPSISLGWAINSLSGNNPRLLDDDFESTLRLPRVKESQSWYVGLQWEDVLLRGNALGMAVGQPTFATGLACGDVREELCDGFADDGNVAWEWWYKWQVSDNISITPALFYLSRPLGQGASNYAVDGASRDGDLSLFGGLVQATFTF